MAEFATLQQIEAATRDLRAWETRYPEAVEAIKSLWRQHLAGVGHKRLGRILLDFEVKPYAGSGAKKEGP